MRSLSELTNEELLELIESIKEKNGGETNARNWSKEDIDRLLELTDRGKQLEELDNNTPEHIEEALQEEAEPVDENYGEDEAELLPDEEAESIIFEETEKASDEDIKIFDISEEHEAADNNERLKSIMNDEAPKRKENIFDSTKKSFSSLAEKIKKSGGKLFDFR